MYQPPHFRENEPYKQHALIRAYPLGLLISAGPAGLLANPIPFHLELKPDGRGLLQAHLAKANPQASAIAGGAEVLVVFSGPDAYVTPSWYATKRESGKVVPTWNYATVQARGSAHTIEDTEWLRRQIELLTADQEARRTDPWAPEDAPESFVAAQIKGIVGIEITIQSLEGKWKVSQNRAPADRAGVIQGLAEAADPHGDAAMAALVHERHESSRDA